HPPDTQPLANNTTGTKPLLVRYPISDSSIIDLMPMVGGYAITNHTGIGRPQITPMVDRSMRSSTIQALYCQIIYLTFMVDKFDDGSIIKAIDGGCCHPLSKPLMVVVATGDEIDEELDRRNQ
ncbi:10458_t:CDS:2, partial [Funneliformis caledonium]